MLELGDGGDLSAAFVNAILLALWAVVPAKPENKKNTIEKNNYKKKLRL